ncbi:hypothetical protein GVAV_003018 [Gurleya vavrai]
MEKQIADCFIKFSIKDAILFSKWAWDEVLEQTIINCWKRIIIIENYDLRVKLPAILNKEIFFRDLNEIEYNLGSLSIEEILSAEEYICFEDQLELKLLLNGGKI